MRNRPTQCNFINKPIDLGCEKRIMSDVFEFSLKNFVELDSEIEDNYIPFDFEPYDVYFIISTSKHRKPFLVISSADEDSPILINNGTDVDSDPSSISMSYDIYSVLKENKLRNRKSFYYSIVLKDSYGNNRTIAFATIDNEIHPRLDE